MHEAFGDIAFAEAEAVAEEGGAFEAFLEPFCEGAGGFTESFEVEFSERFWFEDTRFFRGDAAAADSDLSDVVHEFRDEAELEAGGSEGIDAPVRFVQYLGGFEGVLDIVVGIHRGTLARSVQTSSGNLAAEVGCFRISGGAGGSGGVVVAPFMKAHLPNHPTQLYLIRHGEVEERYHRVFGGSQIDMGLSPAGRAQGEAVERWLDGVGLDAVYMSPMRRVRETVEPLLRRTGMDPVVLPDLREVDFGGWTGLRWEEVQEKFGVSAFDWLEVLDGSGIPGGESAAALVARVGPCLLRILEENPHRRVAVACHGGIIRVILAMLLGQRLANMAHFHIEYGSVTVVERQPEKKHAVEIELLNFCPLRDGRRV